MLFKYGYTCSISTAHVLSLAPAVTWPSVSVKKKVTAMKIAVEPSQCMASELGRAVGRDSRLCSNRPRGRRTASLLPTATSPLFVPQPKLLAKIK